MKFKKICRIVLVMAVIASMVACGNNKDAESVNSSVEDTATTEQNEMNSVKVYYGWGSGDEDKYTTEIYCPEGAQFSEETMEIQEQDGSVMTADVIDEENEYSATSKMYWHRDAYNSAPTAYPIIAQLYFDGELDAETAEENSNCSQEVTPLGFKWNGYDVNMIETTYTFKDYGEQTEVFVGVEYDLDYWKTEEGTGKVSDLTTKALFGFEMYSLGFDDLTTEQCAWIAGELFGVDSGVANPYSETDEQNEETVANIDTNALIGQWVDKESDWEDTYIFNNDGTGMLISGPEYPFTYSVDGNILTLVYDEDDTEDYTVTLDENKLILLDKFEDEQYFEKVIEETVEETETEAEVVVETDSSNPNATAIIGTWMESETGLNETFTFKADGTGKYKCTSEGVDYEYNFTYEFFRSDYIDIYFDDGTEGGFQLVIEDDKMTVRNDTAWDLVYTRQ